LSIYLSILLFVGLGISSCQEHGQDITGTDLTNTLEISDPDLYEQKLKQLSLYMGEVFKDREALRELFELAEADEHKEDIDYSLKRLFETKENPMTRQRSAIVNAFYNNAANHRASGEDLDPQELIDFINVNDISMLAPYMIGYFHPDSIQELTVSWWTEKMEEEALAVNPEWEGETPGYRLRLGEDRNFIRFRKSSANYFTSNQLLVGDDYAVNNPTVVFGNFEDGILPPDDGGIGGGGSNDTLFPIVNSARCQDLNSNSIVRLTMPKFRLTSSIRAWPHPDRMTVVVVLGTNPGGSAYENRPFFEAEVTRGAAKDQRWITSPSSFLVNNWQNRQVDLAFVVFNRRPWSGKEEYNAVVKIKTDESGNTNTEITQELTIGGWQRSQVHGNATFNRCGTIIDPFRDKGFGSETHQNKSYGIEKLNKFEFLLVPEITI
ncbi:MAG TPA: hypothetical protein DCS64_17165, partial [Algoriphagus sp.]